MGIRFARLMMVLLLAVSFCSSAAKIDTAKFVLATSTGPETLDPAYSYDTGSDEIIYQCYDSLIRYDGESLEKFLPMLAVDAPTVGNGLIAPDGKTVRFHIRQGVKFHDGSLLTPADVEYSLERNMLADPARGPAWMLLEPLTGSTAMADLVRKMGGAGERAGLAGEDPRILRRAFDVVDKAVMVDDDQVVLHLPKPYAPLLQILAKGGSWSAIVNKEWMIAHGAWDGRPDTWVKWYDLPKEKATLNKVEMGTGPFILDRLSSDQAGFSRFDEYWRGPARLEKATFRFVQEPKERLALLRDGKVDAAFLTRAVAEALKGQPGIVIKDDLPRIGNGALLFNWTIPQDGMKYIGSGKLDGLGVPPDFFTDLHVRRGFCASFNIEDCLIAANCKGIVPVGPAPAVLPFVNKDQTYHRFNLAVARDEFMQAFAGRLWQTGFQLVLLYNRTDSIGGVAARFVKSGVEAVNAKFKIQIQSLGWQEYLDEARKGCLPAVFTRWVMDFPHVHDFYNPYMHSTGSYAGYCGAALQKFARENFDPLIEEAVTATDPEKSRNLYYQLQKMYYENAVGLPYVEDCDLRVHRDWVKGFVYNPACPARYDIYTLWKETP